MSTLLKKSREGSAKKNIFRATVNPNTNPNPNSPKSRTTSSCATFEQVYSQLLHRRDNEFSTIESPSLSHQLQQLPYTASLEDPYRSALSTPQNRTIIALQRRKYLQMKQRIEEAVQGCSQDKYVTLKELFTARQNLLTEFLSSFTVQLEKECKEKADILKYLWNSSQHLLQSISQALTSSAKQKEKSELENNLRSHLEYQGLLEGYQRKQAQLNEKSSQQRVTINKLVYQLRFKRKEINKLYRNQRLLINKLNDYKSDNLHLQTSYIDLMCSLRDLPPEKAKLLLQARQEIQKSQQIKFQVTANKKRTKNQIKAELTNEKIEELQCLYEQIKEIANNQANSPHLISTLIEASIENFGIKNDDTPIQDKPAAAIPQKQNKNSQSTQTNSQEIVQRTMMNHGVQFGYIEHLKKELIIHKETQTYCQYPKKKLLIHVPSQVNPSELFKGVFTISKVYQEYFKFQTPSQTTIRLIGSPPHNGKRHKKNSSELNNRLRKSHNKISSKDLQDFIEEKDDKSSSEDSVIDEIESRKNKLGGRRVSKIQKMGGKMLNMHASKERYSSILSNSSIKLLSSSTNIDNDNKKSNFAPYTPTSPPPFSNSPSQQPIIIISPADTPQNASVDMRRARGSIRPRESIRKDLNSKFKKSQPQLSRLGFLQKATYFNIEIDAAKQEEINHIFGNQHSQQKLSDVQSEQEESSSEQEEKEQEFDLQKITQDLLNEGLVPQNLPANKKNARKDSSASSVSRSIRAKRPSSSMKYGDENELLMNLCRVSYFKSHKKKEKIALNKYRDEFTCVRDKIEFVARDVKELVVHREALLRKTINSKNLKNTYKILMMTFSKAYDAYNKGTLKGNLIYPLFQSFALLYGAINNNEIYKKMISFIAALALSRQNAILRFFLFFLGLDAASPFSQRVTISEVYLCLKLLEKISVDGKVTLNIESIYTDTTRIKEQLLVILREEKIPPTLSHAIDIRVAKELQNSCLYKNGSSQNSHLKLNIYSIILLVIQEVIKCKNSLKDTFLPLLQRYQQYRNAKKIPVYVLEVLMADWKAPTFDPLRLRALLDVITKNGKRDTVTVEQFCSILFECSLVSIDQLYQTSEFIYRRNWKIPHLYIQQVEAKAKAAQYSSVLEQRQIEMFLKVSAKGDKEIDNPTLEKLRRIIFEKHYQRRVTATLKQTIGEQLSGLLLIKKVLQDK